MSVMATFDLCCDGCAEHDHIGVNHKPRGWRAVLKKRGWTRRKLPDGSIVDWCPRCSGTAIGKSSITDEWLPK